jgi:hypothetical protein
MRFRNRNVQQTIFAYIQDQMATLGWTGVTINFGAKPFTLNDAPPEGDAKTDGNELTLSHGGEPADLEEELGGGLRSCDYVFFIDIVCQARSIAESAASDVKGMFQFKFLPTRDFSTNPAGDLVDGEYLEFENTLIDHPANQPDRRHWRSIVLIACAYFPGSLP